VIRLEPQEARVADQETKNPPAEFIYEDTGAATPMVFFDIVGAYGTMNGTVEMELASRVLVPKPDGTTEIKFLSSVRLRCSPAAAINLRSAIDAALKMLEPQPPQPAKPLAASELN
jgi:hypothetical protein